MRILLFDYERWHAAWARSWALLTHRMHLTVMDLLAIENERMIPQQAASTLTNIEDVESFIVDLGARYHERKAYLYAIDMPANERDKVMHELRYMGITAASMFPGLDGMCEELRERNF